jgi:hypothetical protein
VVDRLHVTTTDDDELTRQRYRHEIGQRAVARREELLDVIVSSILAELPEYGNGRSSGDLEDIRAGVQHSIDLCLSTIDRPRSLDEEERSILRCTGGQRARQGIPKPVVLASVKIAVRVGRTFLMTCTDVGDNPEALMGAFRDITEILDRFEDEACSALAEGHDKAWAHVLSGGDRGEAVLVDRLLEQRFVDGDEVVAHAVAMGLSSSRPAHVVVVTTSERPAPERLCATAADLRPLVMSAVGPLRSTHGLHLPCVVQPGGEAERAGLLDRLAQVGRRHGTTLVLDENGAPLTELAPRYRSVRDSLPFLATATTRPGAVRALIVRFHQVAWSGTPAERAEMLTAIVGPLHAVPERERAELLQTLDALYETGGSVAALARHLHVHKNTLGNRLRRVQEVLGLDVRQPCERLVLETALRMRHVLDAGGT